MNERPYPDPKKVFPVLWRCPLTVDDKIPLYFWVAVVLRFRVFKREKLKLLLVRF